MRKAKVIVAGAGPAGCVAAYPLAQAGIDVILLEAQPSCPEDMRASTLHPPTLDMLGALGFLPEIDAQGLKAPVYQHRNRDTGAVLAVDTSEIAELSNIPTSCSASSTNSLVCCPAGWLIISTLKSLSPTGSCPLSCRTER